MHAQDPFEHSVSQGDLGRTASAADWANTASAGTSLPRQQQYLSPQ